MKFVSAHGRPKTPGSGNTKGFPGADWSWQVVLGTKAFLPQIYVLLLYWVSLWPPYWQRLPDPGGRSGNLGLVQTLHTLPCPHDNFHCCVLSTEARRRWRARLCLTPPSELPFTHPSPSAPSVSPTKKKSGYLQSPWSIRSSLGIWETQWKLWYSFRVVSLP